MNLHLTKMPFPGGKTGTVGSLLKERREELGLSLDEAMVRTRIRRGFLEALEADRFSEIPGETYVCGFLRNYASILGFDPNQVLTCYREQSRRVPGSPSALVEEGEEKSETVGLRRWWLLAVALMVLAAILVGLAIKFLRNEDLPPAPEASSVPSGPAEETPEEPAPLMAPEAVVPEPGAEELPPAIEGATVPADEGSVSESPAQVTSPSLAADGTI